MQHWALGSSGAGRPWLCVDMKSREATVNSIHYRTAQVMGNGPFCYLGPKQRQVLEPLYRHISVFGLR